jgi:hypothetical protein
MVEADIVSETETESMHEGSPSSLKAFAAF